jgi:glycosyltransferase involved in cell wall biosynthesis
VKKYKNMKTNKKIALAMIAKGDGSETKDLLRCIDTAISFVDKCFITLTDNGNGIDTETINQLELYGCEVSNFKWVNDFSKARNFNFSQVPKEYDYIFWLDSDDVIRIKKDDLRSIIEKHPLVDNFSMFYHYAFNDKKVPIVSHIKTRIIKNDGCVEWAGELHEDFKQNRELVSYHIDDKIVDILHLQSDNRFVIAKERNLEIAEKGFKNNPDDPRSFWNLANSQKAMGLNSEAIESFKKFLDKSMSNDEKYIALLRMSEIYFDIRDISSSIKMARMGVGLKPNFPDAYHQLGFLYMTNDRLNEAAEMFLTGLQKRPPIYQMIVFNQLDYSYNPMKNLAKVYISLNRPDLAIPLLESCLAIIPEDEPTRDILQKVREIDKAFQKGVKLAGIIKRAKGEKNIKKKIKNIPPELRMHPMICEAINSKTFKEESSGKDIAFLCGNTAREWDETALKEGIGGSEEAIIHLSRILGKRGYNVEVFNNCGIEEKRFGNVVYKPFYTFNPRDKRELVVLWRSPKLAEHFINADKIFVDLHDVIQNGEFNQKRLSNIDKVFVKSEFHKSLFPNIPNEKFVVVPNGIESDKFAPGDVVRDPNLIINTSSPDRGINGIIDLFERVKKECPQAKMKWCYGWDVFDVVNKDNDEMMAWKKSVIEKMEKAGVENLGRINHDEIIKLHKQANILAYPTDFAEIDCIAVSKALAAGNIVVATDFSSIGEKAKFGYWVKSKTNKDNWCQPGRFDFSIIDEETKNEWVKQCVKALKGGMSEETRQEQMKWAKEKFDWEKVVDVWEKNI